MKIIDEKAKAGIRFESKHIISLYIYFYNDGDMNFNDKRYGDVPSAIYVKTNRIFRNIKRTSR